MTVDHTLDRVISALIRAGMQPTDVIHVLAPRLAAELIREGWRPPADRYGVVIPPDQASETMATVATGTVRAVGASALFPRPAHPPTIVTGSSAGPQGCTHRIGSKWCALPTGHQPPHVPAYTGGGA